MASISRIPKSDNPQKLDDYGPVSVLPFFSKVYERLIAKQLCVFLERYYGWFSKITFNKYSFIEDS